MLTATLRQQHSELAALLGGLERAARGGASGDELRGLLLGISGKLTMHLAAEDRMVYPQLRGSLDAAVAAMARRFADEMGGLGAAFKAFMHAYPAGARIDADRAGFASGLNGILAAITARVKAEETELYPAVDRLAKP